MPYRVRLVAAALSLASLAPVVAEPLPAAVQDTAPASAARLSRVRLSTGVELHVAEQGPPDGEPVLFLHGFTDSWFSFTRTLDSLPPRVRAIAPTQRGHGDSDKPDCCYRVADFAADAVALLDALRIERATIVGHSMGSFIAQRIAAAHPARVKQLVLIGSGATVRTDPVVAFGKEVERLSDPIAAAFIRDFQKSTLHRPVPDDFFAAVVRESQKVPARVWREVMAGLLADDARNELERIASRTFVVWGDKDAMWSRADQDGLVQAIRGARLVTYAGTGHCPHWEDPDRFAADLREFIGAPAASAATPEHGPHHSHASGHHDQRPVAILDGLGHWRHPITTASDKAQRYFDQGLRLTYAFNHDEAVRSFERAVELDATCAMCYWGMAYALGPNINLPMTTDAERRAFQAASSAVRLKERATPLERALIEAMAQRYGEPAGAARAERDGAYASAMRQVARQYADADANVLFADAMLNLRPWNQWTRDGRPQPGTEELVGVLARIVEREPQHAGACHLFIHAVEASPQPERALPCAGRLPKLMPGAGHIVHMPAHVYLRVGRYEQAARANIAAVDADNRYLGGRGARLGFYPLFYAPHNLHFLWAAYVLSGQQSKAINAARALVARVDVQNARANAALEGFLPAVILTNARFGDWTGVLAEPAPPADLAYARGMWHYARGLAFAARGDFASASVERDAVRATAARVKDDVIILLNAAPALLTLAAEVLDGAIAAAQHRVDDAVTHLRTAARLEDALTYDEPPPWYHSVRNMLGIVLLDAGRAREAETAFVQDLGILRETGWSLSGLERALRAQGKTREAAAVARRLRKAWRNADVAADRDLFGQRGMKRPGGTR